MFPSSIELHLQIPQPSKAELSLETVRYECYNQSEPLTLVTGLPSNPEEEENELKELDLWVFQAKVIRFARVFL